ncbi:hypothetical protein B0T18DRAFT_408648 [Schizothecium vesticola]|uniref:Uncharacterized protein n=1 Tax=Schizothecium vesticola TaxID=314040 RepID=A0AA40F3B5_9PEZI|nr:hypothetical protein B0T18DRAFT_408648 [Schizothecium vesticola]
MTSSLWCLEASFFCWEVTALLGWEVALLSTPPFFSSTSFFTAPLTAATSSQSSVTSPLRSLHSLTSASHNPWTLAVRVLISAATVLAIWKRRPWKSCVRRPLSKVTEFRSAVVSLARLMISAVRSFLFDSIAAENAARRSFISCVRWASSCISFSPRILSLLRPAILWSASSCVSASCALERWVILVRIIASWPFARPFR